MTPPTTRDACHSRWPAAVPSTSRTSLFARVMTVWRPRHGGKTKADNQLDNPHPVARTTRESTQPFPYDIVEMIITHLVRDLDTLKACSLACHSWYTVVAPHLHHTLTLRGKGRGSTRDQPNPPSARDKLNPLSELHQLGLMPLVKEFRVEQWGDTISWFEPLAFNPRDLGQLSAFTNVRTLKIQELDIDRFIPGIERYFGKFSLTLQSITLYNPHCTPQQLSHFLSLFSNLDDVGVRDARACIPNASAPDTGLVPFSAPKLRGLLALYDFHWVETWTHLITSCGGLRFRYMDVRKGASCAPVLFEACAETLEILRFNVPVASDRPFPVSEFNLSRLKALRSLQVGAWIHESRLGDRRHTMMTEVFSTITSPAFSELVIALGRHETRLPCGLAFFEALHMMNVVRPFKLVFLLEVSYFLEARRELEEALASVTARGLLDFLNSPPTIR